MILTKSDVDTIVRTRKMLQELADLTRKEGFEQESGYRAVYYGMLSERIREATDSLFEITNIASSYLECPNAEAAHDD